MHDSQHDNNKGMRNSYFFVYFHTVSQKLTEQLGRKINRDVEYLTLSATSN